MYLKGSVVGAWFLDLCGMRYFGIGVFSGMVYILDLVSLHPSLVTPNIVLDILVVVLWNILGFDGSDDEEEEERGG